MKRFNQSVWAFLMVSVLIVVYSFGSATEVKEYLACGVVSLIILGCFLGWRFIGRE